LRRSVNICRDQALEDINFHGQRNLIQKRKREGAGAHRHSFRTVMIITLEKRRSSLLGTVETGYGVALPSPSPSASASEGR
jgi:hypothetical protein